MKNRNARNSNSGRNYNSNQEHDNRGRFKSSYNDDYRGSSDNRDDRGPGRSAGWDNEDQYATYDDRSPDEHHYRNTDNMDERYREGRDYQKKNSEHTWGEHSSTSGSGRDENIKNSNRGKGPKGYKRSDDRIQENVSEKMSDDHQLDASEIEVKVEDGEVTLTGEVSNRDDKRRAEDLAESVSGVTNVENRLRVSSNAHNKKEESESNGHARDKTKTRQNHVLS